MEMEVITTTDKQKRDAMFQELRNSTEANERQAVKFSSNEPVLGEDGKQLLRPAGSGNEKLTVGVWQSNWSVAYPVAL